MASRPPRHPTHQSSLPHQSGGFAEEAAQLHMQGVSHTPGRLEGTRTACPALVRQRENLTPPPLAHRGVQDGLVFRVQVAYHREPQVLRESVNAEGMLIVRDNEEAQALEMATAHKPLLTSTLHG